MDIPLDHFGGRLIGLVARPQVAAAPVPLDWPGLVARLAAAHAARQVLPGRGRSGNAAPSSFAPGVAADMARWQANAADPAGGLCIPDVNRAAKVDGKSLGSIGWTAAGKSGPMFEDAHDR